MQAAFKMQDDPAAMIGVSRRECVAAMAEVLTCAPYMLCFCQLYFPAILPRRI